MSCRIIKHHVNLLINELLITLCFPGLLVYQINCAVIPREGTTVTEEDIKAFCKKNLAAFKVPKRVFITDNLPKTASGKIQRRIVAQHFLEKP